MSYADIRKQLEQQKETDAPIDYHCPAHGCPNAAAVSFDGRRWSCYYHARAEAKDWPQVTQWILDNWPRSCNWNHPDKVAYEHGAAAKRRAALPVRRRWVPEEGEPWQGVAP